MNTGKYKNHFTIAFDTICDGNQCVMDGHVPALFKTKAEAMFELFDSALGMLLAQDEQTLEELEVSPEQIARMKELNTAGDATLMEKFLDDNPQCNYNAEFVQPASEFILNRKAIFTGNGGYIAGKKLEE